MDNSEFSYEHALHRCAAGDRHALHQIYEREGRWLLAVAQRIVRNRQIAEDVLQDAFINIWTRSGTFDESRGSARGWIYTVTRHRALQEVRGPHSTRRVDTDDLDALMAQYEASPPYASPGEVDRLEHCLSRLDPDRRQCVEAAFVHGYTQQELAERLDKPLGTVKSWIRRALLALRECLQ